MEVCGIFHSCEFVKVDPPDVPTVIGLVSGVLFSLGAIGLTYMNISHYLPRLSRCHNFLFFVAGVDDFE